MDCVTSLGINLTPIRIKTLSCIKYIQESQLTMYYLVGITRLKT